MQTSEIILIVLSAMESLLLYLNNKKMIEALVTIFGATVGIIILVILASCYGAFSWGLIFWKFWYWFLLPVFPQVPEITFLQAVGLMFVVDLFKNQVHQQIKAEYKDDKSTGLLSLIYPWLTLGIGWLFKIVFL